MPGKRDPLHYEQEGDRDLSGVRGAEVEMLEDIRGGMQVEEGGKCGGRELARDVQELAGAGACGHLVRVDLGDAEVGSHGCHRDSTISASNAGAKMCAEC